MKTIKITDTARLRPLMTAVFETVSAALIGGPVEIEIKRPCKSREQEARYHAMIGDIAATVTIDGRKYDRETWKALLVEDFAEDMRRQGTPLSHPGRVIPSLDGTRVVTIRPSSRRFRKSEAAEFIEYLYATGTELGARFSDPALRYYEEIAEREAYS